MTDSLGGGDSTDSKKSILDLVPRERGGVEARTGFVLQDHVGVSFCLEMIGGNGIEVIWCEADDDLTIVRRLEGGGFEPEFVQVKGEQLDQLWSPSKLCEQEGGAAGTSLLEKSLSHDKYKEPAFFRIVTARDVNRVLRHLKYPLPHADRLPGCTAHNKLAEKLTEEVKRFKSGNGNDWTFWVVRVRWDVASSVEAVVNSNLVGLTDLVHAWGVYLAPDQRDVLHQALLRAVSIAAQADTNTEAHKKKLSRDQVLDAVQRSIVEATESSSVPRLEAKLIKAGLTEETLRYAKDARLRFLKERREQRYFSSDAWEVIELRVADRLGRLWVQLESGALIASPLEFYRTCVEAVEEIGLSSPAEGIPTIMLHGAMFDRVDRCLHRFDVSDLVSGEA